MKNSDVVLIQRVLAGNDDAFSELVKKYQKQVHALAWRKIGDFHIAEEITQDTFLNAYKRLTTLKEPQLFASWLYVIAANRCSSWLRKKRLPIQSIEHLDQTDTEQLEKAAYSEFVVEENERISGEEQREVVKKLLAKLGESERTVMTLHYFGEMSCAEIGAFMGVSANTVKSRLRRAQQRLQKEETMIREALDNFKITPHLTDNVMREISRIKPATPTSNKPFVPWAIAASTLAVVLLMFGFGSNYLGIFQKPYSLDATAEMTVEIVDASIVANLEAKPDVSSQIAGVNLPGKPNNPEQQLNGAAAAIAEVQAEETVKDNTPMEDWTKWELPKAAKARLGKGGIRAMQFSPDGSQLAVGSNIGVWLYDVKTGKELTLFPGICESIAFSPDGRFLVNGGGDFFAYFGGRNWNKGPELWEIKTGRKISFPKISSPSAAIHYSEDGKTLVSSNRSERTISTLDIETKKKTVTHMERHKGFISPEPHALTNDKLAVGGQDGTFELWDITTGKKLSTLGASGFNKHVFSLAFSPNGALLASGSEDATVRLWDTISNNELMTLRKHTGWVNVLAFSPDGKMIASGSTDKTVQLWDTNTGKPLDTFTGFINGITALTFSTDGTTLATGSADGSIRFWNTNTGNLLSTHISGHTEWVPAVTFIEDSRTLASVAFNGIITLWDLETSQNTNQHVNIIGYRDWLAAAAFSPDGRKLASIAEIGHAFFEAGKGISRSSAKPGDDFIRLKDVNTGRELQKLAGAMNSSSVVFSPDGKTVAFGGHGSIRMWNTESGEHFDISLLGANEELRLTRKPIISVLVFSPDGKTLLSGTEDGKVQMWKTETGTELTPIPLFEAKDLEEEDLEAIKQEGKTIQVQETTVVIDGVRSPTITYYEPIRTLAFSPDGTLLAMGSNKRIRLFGIKREIGFKELPYGAETLQFSPDNSVLLCGFSIGRIELWDLATVDKLSTLEGHTAAVQTLVFSPDGKTLVSTGKDGTILVWDWDEVLKGSVGE